MGRIPPTPCIGDHSPLARLDEALSLLMCARTRFQEGNFKEARISKALGILWCQKGQYRLAVRELYHAVRLENKCFGALHPNVVNTFRNMSVPYCRLNKVSKAVQLNQVALQIMKRCGSPWMKKRRTSITILPWLSPISETQANSEQKWTITKSHRLYLELYGVEGEKTRRTWELLRTFRLQTCT